MDMSHDTLGFVKPDDSESTQSLTLTCFESDRSSGVGHCYPALTTERRRSSLVTTKCLPAAVANSSSTVTITS